jgi:O-glycosyl hydrolase/regulation of enolase protein 1 (concanavalin A-like superfamily)
MKKNWLALFSLLFVTLKPALPAQTVNISATVDPTTVLVENYKGWGTSLCWFANVVGGLPNRQDFMDLIFTSLKLNIVRYNIGGGENPNIPDELGYQKRIPGFEPSLGVWNWSADANQRWVLREAVALGANHVEAFANSPPWWMTVSGSVTGAQGNTGHNDNLQTAYETDFASYLATVVSNLTVLDGIHFELVTPMNEPEGPWEFSTNSGAQEGCHMDSGQQARVVNDLHAALNVEKAGATGIDAPETYAEGDVATAINAYGSATNNVAVLTSHTYGTKNISGLHAEAVGQNKPLWITEFTESDGSGLTMARRIHDDVTGTGAEAWMTWQAVDNRNGYGFLQNPLDGSGNTNYTFNEKFYVMGQFSEYVRPGFQIINVNDNYSFAAYNPTNETLVIVALNDGSSTLAMSYDLSRFAVLPATGAAVRTSATEKLASQPVVTVANKGFSATLIPKSVTTFIFNNVALTTSLSTPTGLVATPGNNEVALTWNASIGATSYNVKRSTTSGSGYATIASPTSASYTDSTAVNGTTYYYVVSAVNGSGESANSSQVSATPGPVAPPVPTGLGALAGNNQVALTWNSSIGATSYNVGRSTTSGSGYATIASPTTANYTDTTAVNGTTYYYVVSAVNGNGQSANSSEVAATPSAASTNQLLLNPGFEQPGTGKITTGYATVPGWANAGTTYSDTGVETSPAPHSGAYSAYCKGSDGGAYQIANYQMNAGDTITLTWWAEHSGGAGSSTQAVSLVSASSLSAAYSATTALIANSAALNGSGSSAGPWTQYTLAYQATATDVGRYVGVYFNNATPGNWDGFDDFSLTVTSPTQSLPSPWATSDIGAVGVAGGATDTNGLFTITGSGTDIWGTADAFHYVYQPASGNCSIQAEVLSVQNSAPWAKAGVMIRETTNANSTYAIMFLAPVTATSTNGVAFQERAATGGSASSLATVPGVQAPYWVQLARTGNSFVASYSANGTAWTALATNTITMATNAYIGIPVCSVNNSVLNTATFTNVAPTP